MSTNELIIVDDAYNKTLNEINNYIYYKEIKKSYIAKKFGISRQTLYDYLNGNTEMPYRFILFMRHMMNSDPR